ncbi:cytochrome c biogenesis CcdA family protein, partial [Peptostreptococcus porci]|uniref:cytochrome c biogenesis CcdA family protein n=1 Tax=Peptostreptococcus porci TaxID=2652282 RepID=UPI0023F30E52
MHETIVKNREKGCDFIGTFNLGNNINFLMVFLEGVISFFSPCVIPLIPLYMSYLAGEVQDGSTKLKNRNKIMLHTFFFVLGISTTFFILGLGFSSLGNVIREQGRTFSIVSGIIIILLGLKQLGVLKFSLLDRNFGVSKGIGDKKMNPIMAFIMGFGFSFAWTPCVGPALASVLLMASNASSSSVGNIYILLYSLG